MNLVNIEHMGGGKDRWDGKMGQTVQFIIQSIRCSLGLFNVNNEAKQRLGWIICTYLLNIKGIPMANSNCKICYKKEPNGKK